MSALLTPAQVHTVLEKAMRDQTFRQTLRQTPHAAIEQELGVTVPTGKTVHVVDIEAQPLTLVLPQPPADWPAGLSLEAATARLQRELPDMDEAHRRITERQAQLIAKAWQDHTFKQNLLRDAKATVSQELGVPLPADLHVQCVADDDEHQYLLLPPVMEGTELSDEQLNAVAGGEAVVALTIVASLTHAAVSAALSAAVTLGTSW
jgi:hypothetical protein